MQIFLAGSIHGKSQSESTYRQIVDEIKKAGHTVVSEYLLTTSPSEMAEFTPDQHITFHRQILDGIRRADAVFAEVSYPSISVGYLMSVALQANKPTVAFYQGTQEPNLLKALERMTDKLQVARYQSSEELKQEVKFGLEFVSTNQDVRFNFFITPDLSSYLDWVSRSRKVPRSVYLRRLIDEEMARQTDFEESVS